MPHAPSPQTTTFFWICGIAEGVRWWRREGSREMIRVRGERVQTTAYRSSLRILAWMSRSVKRAMKGRRSRQDGTKSAGTERGGWAQAGGSRRMRDTFQFERSAGREPSARGQKEDPSHVDTI